MRGVSFFILLSLFMAGCFPTQKLPTPVNLTQQKLAIDFAISKLEFKDLREETTAKPPSLPIIGKNGQVIKYRPELDSNYQNMLEQIVRASFTGDSVAVEVTVIVEEAYKEFSATFIQEKETVLTQLKVEALHRGTGTKVFAFASANFSRGSGDAEDAAFEELYRTVLKNTLWTALKEIQEQTKQQPKR